MTSHRIAPAPGVAAGVVLLAGVYLVLAPWLAHFGGAGVLALSNTVTGLVLVALAIARTATPRVQPADLGRPGAGRVGRAVARGAAADVGDLAVGGRDRRQRRRRRGRGAGRSGADPGLSMLRVDVLGPEGQARRR